ncbi:hypothetical protein [Zoogloea sp.]|uniref:hypothetical protein n=1 Tax=Zoogloea sp. TaxID=49181 RepID=UPI0035B1B88C
MAEVTLYRVPGTNLFVNCNPAGTAGNAAAGAFCFYHAADTLLDTLTFTETLKVRGAYGFLRQNTSNPFGVLAAYLQGQVMAKERVFLWMDSGWASASEQLLVKNGVSDQALALSLPALTFIGMPDEGPDAGSMKLVVPGAAAASFGQDEIILVHKDAQVEVTVGRRTANLSPRNGIVRIRVAGGPGCSTLNGELDESDTAKIVAVLAPQTRYRWRKPNTSVTETRAARILSDDRGAHTGVTAEFRLHRHCTDISSTSIGLVTKDATGGLRSELMDTDGYVLTLQPKKNAAIYFDNSASGSHASLNGKFAVQKSPADELATVSTSYRQIMPGASGTEFFQLGKDGYDGLEFFAAQPAFIAYGTGSENPNLSGQATTAWMAPCRTGGLQPFADSGFSFVTQPQDQPLYGRREVSRVNQSVDAFSVLFDPAPIQVEAPTGLPFFPIRGVRRKTLDDATARIDSGALAPIRSQMAAASKAKASTRTIQTFNAPTTWITTPQGLLVEIDEQNTWHRIKLGESEAVDDWQLVIDRPKDINDKPVERWALQEALSRPDVFVVVTRNDPSFIPGAEDPPFGKIALALKIAGWPMVITFADAGGSVPGPPPPAPTPPTRFEPAMVMKLTKGPIRDFLSDVSRWSLARVFNGDPRKSSLAALKSLENLKMLSEGLSPLPETATNDKREMAPELKQHYRELYNRICDDNWTGILIFNAESPFKKVPDHVAVVTEGAPTSKAFSVPVLGIDVSRVVPGANNEMKLEKTSAFGAIHFHDSDGLEEKGEFEFKLRTLNAVFMNTQLRIFLASMQLRLSQFFGAQSAIPAKPTPGNSRILDILARYETVAKDGVTSGEYVFRALGRRTMKFENNEFLTSMSATRIDVTCTRKGVEPDRYVESRFAFWGQLEFGSKFSSVTGIRKIEFDNAALIMSQNNFNIDVGKVRVDFKKEDSNSDLSGLLAKFPLQLFAMRWSSSANSLSLPSVGFTGLSLPGFGGFAAPSFDFAIELDLNLGSMGKLFEGANFLKAKILVGWYDVKNQLKGFSIGFRFEGGNGPLDIGINGVLRLTAESVKIQSYTTPSAGIGIGLIKPQLEVMGYKVPTNPTDVLVAFVPANGDNVAWGWARLDTKVGPLLLDYFAIGQRMKLVPDQAWGQDTSLGEIVQKSKGLMFPNGSPGTGEIPDIGSLYIPDAGWGVVARGKVFAFNFRFVFLDGLNRYGLGLEIPKLAKVDVIYRKLSDNQGVFSAEIEPAFRTLEMGAATVTLPVFGFEAVTNGNWALNIGYHGNDFSRGTTVQILPFIGSGGVRFGKLDWQSSYVLNSPDSPNLDLIRQLALDPVIEMSLAVRVGFGKEYREGIFAAGLTLSIYGIFEGAVGTPTHPNFPSAGNRRYIRVDGTMGLLLEIFGAVSFSLISAAVSIRVWIEAGITFESYAPVLFHAEAGVSVFVRFVIARLSAFGKSWEIAINFSFATRVRFTQKIIDSFDGPRPDLGTNRAPTPAQLALLMDERERFEQAVQPLKWVCHAFGGKPVVVSCSVSAEPMLSGPAPVLLPMLMASDVDAQANGLGGLSARLFEWAFRLSKNVDPRAQTPERFTLADLETLSSRVTPPKESLSRWGDMPLTFAVLEKFFEAHLKLELITVAQLLATQGQLLMLAGKAVPTKPTGVPLPWFADIAMNGSFDSAAPTLLRNFRGADRVNITKKWEDTLHDRLAQSIPDFPKDEKTQLKLDYLESRLQIMQTGDRQAMDVVVEDWAAAVVQGVVNQALRAARRMSEEATVDGKPPLDLRFESLLEVIKKSSSGESVCLQVMQHASTFLHHGLRVPTADELSTVALSTLLKTELDLNSLCSQGKTCELSFSPRTGFAGNWIQGAANLSEFSPADALNSMRAAAKRLASEKVDLTLELEDSIPGKTTQPRRFIASSLLPFGSANAQQASLRMAAVPEALFALSQDRKAPLKIETALENPSEKSTQDPFTPRWFVKLEIRLEAAASATAVAKPGASRAVYSILSVDPRIRDLMLQMNVSTGPAFAAKVRLGFKAKGDQPAVPFVFLEDKEAFLFVSNLSNEPHPPRHSLVTAKSSEAPSFSHLDDCMAVAQMLWMANTVNSPGFHLAFEGADPIEHLFKSESVASVSAVFELSALVDFLPMVDGLLLDATQVNAGTIVSFTTPDVFELVAGTPDGQVAVVVTRSNPLYGIGLYHPVEDWRALSARYELVDYWTKSTAKTLALQRDCVMPVRVYMTEIEQAEAVVKEPPSWPHRLLVPLSEISHRTLMRIGKAGDRPNPYQFVGENLKDLIEVGARDGAGHLLEDGLNAHWKAGSETRILYRDSIFKLQELPGVTSTWNLAKVSASAAEMQLALDWNSDVLLIPVPAESGSVPAPQPKPIPDDQRLAYLTQLRRYVDMVGMADFTAKIVVSMGDAPFGSPLDVKTAMLDWLKEICAAIEVSGKGIKRCKLPKFSVPIDQLPKTTEKPVLVSVAMELRREKALCDKRSEHDEVAFSSSPIHPKQLQSDKDWEDWSKRVGTALGGAFTLLRRVEGRTEPRRARREGSMIFLMRRSMLSTSKVKATSVDYFAPTPLAKALLSGLAAVPTPNGPLTEFEVRDVDLNAVAARASAALETLLTGQIGEALCRIAKPAGLYPRLTSAKKKLADNLAGRMRTLVDGGAKEVPQSALIKFRDDCRVDTTAAFSPNAAVTVGLPGVVPADNKVFLWGSLNVSPDDKMDPSQAFTSVRIALTSGGIGGSFDFVAKWTAQSASPRAKITGLMTFQPRYVEVQSEEDVVGYKPSDWYQVLWTTEIPVKKGITIEPNTGSEWQIPLPLRQVPPTPFILRQVCEPAAVPTSVPLGDYIAAAKTWDYRLSCLSPKEEHDTAIATVRFEDASALTVMTTGGLFAALAAFVKYEALVAELTGQLCAGAVPDAGKLEMTVAMFESISANIGEMSASASSTSLGSQSRVVSLNTVQPNQSGKLGEIHWAVDAVPNRPVRASLLSINAAEETEIPIPADSESAGVARYKPRPDVTSAFAGLANVYPRRLSFEGLDVMVESRASASLMARRNADLIDKAKISEDFIFETATVRTPDSLVPHLAHVEAYDISFGDNTPRTIEHWLEQIETQIFKGANRTGFAIDVLARLHLRLLQDSPTTGIQFKVPLPSIKGVPAMKVPTDTSDAWYKTLAGHLLTQARRLSDDAVKNGFLELTIQVFATSGPESKRPVLSLQNLRLPLAKIVLKSALDEFYRVRSLPADSDPSALQVAAFVFARTRRLSSKGSQLKQARKALAMFALSMDGLSHSNEALPSVKELASAKVRESWVACMVEAVAATRAERASSYATLVLGPAELQGNTPAAAVRHWAMAIEPSLAVKVAGPMSDESTNDPQSENIYLWGISLPAGNERKLIRKKAVKTKIRPKYGKVKNDDVGD